ncbi:MAG: copper homeostasis protein CutC [Gemmatimonadaceae bacterium]|nr:copper homeostasis protein CutC [Gemmatimonadaceae bacterium]
MAHTPFSVVLVEACCDSVSTARAAVSFGANRIELCGPGDGGTTPSHGLMASCRAAVAAPIHAMIRPHTRDFIYDAEDVGVMLRDIDVARSLGMDGVVFGPLSVDNTVDRHVLQALVSRAHAGDRRLRVAFHRAFDRTPDAIAALDAILEAGVDLILTAGHQRTALEGAAELQQLQRHAGDRLVILAGGTVRGSNVRGIVQNGGVHEVHVRGTDPSFIRDTVTALRHS